MKYLSFLMIIAVFSAQGQNIPVSDQQLTQQLKKHVVYLSDDKLEGRRTGTKGEKLAHRYISKQFKNAGLKPLGSSFLQPFTINEGKEAGSGNAFTINGTKLILNKDYFPLAYSANGMVKSSTQGVFRILDLKLLLEANTTNPHFDLHGAISEAAVKAKSEGASALVLINTSVIDDKITSDLKDKNDAAPIPVVYVSNKPLYPSIFQMGMKKLNVDIRNKTRTGHNVIGQIDNNASTTIVLGAHYDHLGYGEDRNSLHSGKEKMIHNGADDNASGTAGLIELARSLNDADLKNNNYIFVAFSGEELGLYGSKYLVENPPFALDKVNYMINMDMIGRLDTAKGMTVGGYGTSPVWSQVLSLNNDLKIKFDSSGSGPSDHTSFYRRNIPVLFFFTGAHQDYHKPSDDADKINYDGQREIVKYIYNVIAQTNDIGKIAFLRTKEPVSTRTSFKVSMGIMPDYTFSGNGIKVDGVSEDRPAHKAGLQVNDVVFQLGDHRFSDVQGYMEALSKFNKGDSTVVKVIRGGTELSFNLTF